MTQRLLLCCAVAALALSIVAFGATTLGFVRLARDRQTSLQDWTVQRCSNYVDTLPGADDPCSEGTPETLDPRYQAALRDVAGARAALARGDELDAEADLGRALERASEIELRSSLVATMLASRIVSDVLDIADAHPEVDRRPELRARLWRTRLVTTRRPLEATRLRVAMAALRATPPTVLVTSGVTEWRAADAIEREDALLLGMQRAAAHGDLAACERAAEQAGMGAPAALCRGAIEAVRTGRRLEQARRR